MNLAPELIESGSENEAREGIEMAQLGDSSVLGDLVKIRTGIQSGGSAKKRRDTAKECDARVIKVRDVTSEHTIDYERLTTISTDADLAEKHWLKSGQVLFFGRMGQRYTVLIEGDVPQGVLVDKFFFVITIRNREQVRPDYLAWFLNSGPAQKFFKANESGSPHGFISKATLDKLPIDLPGLDIQERIGAVWSRWKRKKQAVLEALDSEGQLIAAKLDQAAWSGIHEQ
ncbi:restriction endonuclease subunit S [Desulfonatronum sp. SC1]|uniref:restriction endonuclease subunit S n=1 Tax=Desulfonatronum sp. SC1 TaxID=2109626 RepID=UPI000D2FD8EF|nr:restriction endonuclease subunit S [Desulfonatronum sp. SC1]PTN31770.1 hypothetical protein C6366_17625 [Desulfonatronum sp. SC1]